MAERMDGAETLLEGQTAWSAPSMTSLRAVISPGTAKRLGKILQMRPAPSSAIASAVGLKRGEKQGFVCSGKAIKSRRRGEGRWQTEREQRSQMARRG